MAHGCRQNCSSLSARALSPFKLLADRDFPTSWSNQETIVRFVDDPDIRVQQFDGKDVGATNFLIGILTNLSHGPSWENRRFLDVTTIDLKTAVTLE
jgi:hypothetical protein